MRIFEKTYIPYQLPTSYRTPKTRANDAAADVLLQNDVEKHEKLLIFSKNICLASVP